MPEIDLRKLREMQLIQSSNLENQENTSHESSSWSEDHTGIVDLWVSTQQTPIVANDVEAIKERCMDWYSAWACIGCSRRKASRQSKTD